MDANLLRALVTAASFVAFGLIAWWAYTPARRGPLDAIGRSVLADDDATAAKEG